MSLPRTFLSINDGNQVIELEIESTYGTAERIAAVIEDQIAYEVVYKKVYTAAPEPEPEGEKPGVVYLPENVTGAGIEERIQMYNRLNQAAPPFVRDENGKAPPAPFFTGDWIPEAYAIQEAQGTLKPATPYSVISVPRETVIE